MIQVVARVVKSRNTQVSFWAKIKRARTLLQPLAYPSTHIKANSGDNPTSGKPYRRSTLSFYRNSERCTLENCSDRAANLDPQLNPNRFDQIFQKINEHEAKS